MPLPVWVCTVCMAQLCPFHVEAHQRTRLTADHGLADVRQLLEAPALVARVAAQRVLRACARPCETHPSEPAEVRCVPCGRFVCGKCAVVEPHAAHERRALPDWMRVEREARTTTVASLRAHLAGAGDVHTAAVEVEARLRREHAANVEALQRDTRDAIAKLEEQLRGAQTTADDALQASLARVTTAKDRSAADVALSETLLADYQRLDQLKDPFAYAVAAETTSQQLATLLDAVTLDDLRKSSTEATYSSTALTMSVREQIPLTATHFRLEWGRNTTSNTISRRYDALPLHTLSLVYLGGNASTHSANTLTLSGSLNLYEPGVRHQPVAIYEQWDVTKRIDLPPKSHTTGFRETFPCTLRFRVDGSEEMTVSVGAS